LDLRTFPLPPESEGPQRRRRRRRWNSGHATRPLARLLGLVLEELLNLVGDVLCRRVLNLQNSNLVGRRARVELLDDALEALHVRAQVVDDDGVGLKRNRVARRKKRAVAARRAAARFDVLDLEHARHHLLVGRVDLVRVHHRRYRVLLRALLIDDLEELAVRVDREAVRIERREKRRVELIGVDLDLAVLGADDRNLAPHVLGQNERLARGVRDGLNQLLDLDLVEIDVVAGLLGEPRRSSAAIALRGESA